MMASSMLTQTTFPNGVLVLGAGSLILMALVAIRRHVMRDAVISALILIAAAFSLAMPQILPHLEGLTLFRLDSWSTFTSLLIIFCAISVILMAPVKASGGDAQTGSEFYILLLISTLGGVAMTSAVSIVTFFIGLETLSLSLIGLIAFNNRSLLAGEAGMKYLILSGVASGMMLFGFALIYAETGSLTFRFPNLDNIPSPGIAYAGLTLLLTGLFFKLSAVPFHLWLADVLEGASIPVAVIIAVISKVAVFAAMMRYFSTINLFAPGILYDEIAIVAILSMVGGNLLAIVQKDLRRLMAGSSIAHIGYLLVAFLSPMPYGFPSAAFYLAAYTVSTLAVFAVMAGVMPQSRDIRQWHGLARKRPFATLVMSIALVSLAGIPPVVGFFAKFYVAAAGLAAHRHWLLAALVISSVIGLFYYLRVIFVMMTPGRHDETHELAPQSPNVSNVALITILACLTVMLGALPNGLILRSQSLEIGAPPLAASPTLSSYQTKHPRALSEPE